MRYMIPFFHFPFLCVLKCEAHAIHVAYLLYLVREMGKVFYNFLIFYDKLFQYQHCWFGYSCV
jgi:hypothetical protein